METPLARRLLAELAGTTILCLFGIGAAAAVARVEAGGPGLLVVALAHGLALAVAIYAFGSASGGHFNPTVTVALAARARFPWREVPAYVLAQLLGGTLGATVIHLAYAGSGTTGGLGATTLAQGVNVGQGLLAEAFGAFLLVTAVYALAVSPSAPRGVVGFGIGLALAVQIMAIGPLTGASVNFARTLGPDLVLAVTGGEVAWSHLVVYLVGPIVGGLAAALLYEVVSGLKAARPTVERV
ncbi:MAG TPA: aquaporin [Umezawaea sp.]|nr:aquaporin [Umezawaea sp.]